MSQTDENQEPMTNMEQSTEEAPACGPGCDCNAGPSGWTRWMVGAVIVVIAGVLIVRAVLKDASGQPQAPDANFALPQPSVAKQATAAKQTTADSATRVPEDKPVVCGELIRSLGDLNRRAMDKDAVFVFLAGQDADKDRKVTAVIEKGATTLRGRGVNMGLFTLETGSSEFTNLARQFPHPAVIAMVKGRGATAVSDDITESKLVQAFVAASSVSSCGPSGCGPSGCK